MSRRLRQIVTVGAFAVCLTVSLAAAVAVLRQGAGRLAPAELVRASARAGPLAEPVLPAGDQELRLLVAQDLTKAPRENQLALAMRLEQFFRTRRDWRPDQDLNPEQLRQLQENLTELARVWFLWKADQYAMLQWSQREAFLDDLLGLADAFLAMPQLAPRLAMPVAKGKPLASLAGQPKPAGPAWWRLLAKLQERTTPEEQTNASALGMALHERWQLRTKKQGGKP